MALVKCVECKKEISSSVKVCPYCGKKDPTVGVKEYFIGFIILVLIILFIPQFCSDSNNKNIDSAKSSSNTISSEPSNETSEKEIILYGKVKKIPASEIYKNRDGYKQLLELNPSNELYKRKISHYNKLIQNQKAEKESAIISQSAKFVHELIKEGAITADNNSFRIYVEPTFWNMMDYSRKESFCFVVHKAYPRHSIVDKYSGKKLAELNFLGEINIIE